MTNENRTKYLQACLALKKLDISPQDFVDLDMAACFECWAEDDPTPLTVDQAMDIHHDTGYFEAVIENALAL